MSVLFVHNDLDKNTLKLQHPKGIKGGAYTSVISHNEDRFYLQLPKCMLRNGIVKTDKKIYCDLLFDKYDEEVVSWFENLQNIIQELIYEKKNVWFNGEIEKDDIEDTFINMIKTYRSGKNYLVRCYLPKDISTVACYNDEQENVELDSIVGEETNLIPLVEITNLRFTSRNFQVDLVLREVMIDNDDDSDSEGDDDENSDDENTDDENTDNEEQEENNDDVKKEEKDEINENVEKEVINESVPIELNIEDISDTNIELTKANIKENLTEEVTEENIENVEKQENVEKEEKDEKKVTEENIEKQENIKKEEKDEKNENVEKEEVKNVEEKDGLQEVSLDLDTLDNSRTISLKSPQNVYYAIWQNAKQRLKFHRAEALKAFLEAKNIKNTHLINEIDNDSEDEFKMEQ